jgi:hypothetical protein
VEMSGRRHEIFLPWLHFCDLYYLGTVSAGKLGFIRLDTILYRSFSFLFYESEGLGKNFGFEEIFQCNDKMQELNSNYHFELRRYSHA